MRVPGSILRLLMVCALTRIVDYNDWQLNPALFWQLDLLWGLHTVDRFADNHNVQLACFDSRW